MSRRKEPVDIFTLQVGDKVVYNIPTGGYEGDIKNGKQKLSQNEAYTVKSIDIGGWRTDIELDGVEGSFNSCLFQKATK